MSAARSNILRQRPRLLYAGINDTAAGWISDKETCENAEFVLVTRGSGKAEIKNETYPFSAGDLIVYNRGCEHRESLDGGSDREIIFLGVGNLHLQNQPSDVILADKDYSIVHTEEYFPALECYFKQLVAETEGSQPLHETIAENLLRIILLYVLRLVSFDSELTFRENAGYLKAKKYFDEHFLEIEDIDSVCKSLYINKYYLSHLFNKNEGMPPVKYLVNKRIELACKLLEANDDNVADIGKACGYVDPCYFSRVFKKVKGVTPLRYRYLFKLEKAEKNKKQ